MLSAEEIRETAAKRLAGEPAPMMIDYSRALRAIGQDLANLFPKILEIEADGDRFIVRGQSHPNPFHNYRKLTCKDVWRHLLGKPLERESPAPELASVRFERRYAPENIDHLDQLSRAERTGQLGRPDNYSLAERLRVMGGIVDSRKGRLKCLRKDGDKFLVEYWDESGEVRSAKLTTIIMYRNPQNQPVPGTPKELWEGYDF